MKVSAWRDLHGVSIFPYLLLLPIVTIWPLWLSKVHYRLPTPLGPTYVSNILSQLTIRDVNGRPQASEDVAVSHMQALEDIGYRTVGTEEALAGEEYVLDQVNLIASRCKLLDCEVSVQKGSGYHE
jgi:predicted solute-binding protein